MASKATNTTGNEAPFTCNILDKDGKDTEAELDEAFAASYRFKDDFIAPICVEARFLRKEFDLDRLHNIMQHLWMAGRPAPPRPLHHQILLRREVVISERLDMHLVWGRGCLFLKPIPRFLLIPDFWKTSFETDHVGTNDRGNPTAGTHRNVRECALGFLLSYTALVAHESDFHIAQDKHLVPAEVTWQKWRLFVREILTSSENLQWEVADRFMYGELRLTRLNLIYFFIGSFSRVYLPRWNSYGSFFKENTQFVIAATAYIVVILSALQVGLATQRLRENTLIQDLSYGFTIFSIVAPAIFVPLVLLAFCAGFVINWVWTEKTQKERMSLLGRSWSIRGKIGSHTGIKRGQETPAV
ncbi:uncharacterized protein RAG0_11127 [Rhynchosporium agropyri]|uniref:Uncharacterized protein n=1 Tax=Rhynchosporium agropyri TaxID=914238 RepID=A0A1E1L2Y4_9HELO|nr:uncharacterized protein RAG0_11127 [Rhynchosporium agropyri]